MDHGIQELQELTGSKSFDRAILICSYQKQYSRGWDKSRAGRDLACDVPEAERQGYEDYAIGQEKWSTPLGNGLF